MTTRSAMSAAVALLLTGFPPWSHAQGDNPLLGADIRHVGVIVANVDAAAESHAALLGLPVPESRAFPGVPFPPSYRGDRAAHPKVATFRLSDVSIELLEPVGGSSPWRDHLDRYGAGLHHIALGVTDVEEAVVYLESKGGTRVLGTPGFPAAYVDLKPLLGFTIELNEVPAGSTAQPVPAQRSSGLGSNAIAHVGVFVDDVERAGRLFGEIMGMEVPEAVAYQGLQFPDDFEGDRDAHPRIISLHPEGSRIAVEFAEPQGGRSPWRDHVDRFGSSMHHLAFRISGMREQVAFLEEQGGRVVLGGAALPYAFVDLKPEPLGFAIELIGQ